MDRINGNDNPLEVLMLDELLQYKTNQKITFNKHFSHLFNVLLANNDISRILNKQITI